MTKILSKFTSQNIAIILMIAIFFMADRYLKVIALAQGVNSLKLVGNLFSFTFTPNYYMAFSLPFGGQALNALVIIAILLLIYLIYYLIINKKTSKIIIVLLTIILFGAISNILDRIVYGYVVDYFYLRYFTVFNIADMMISVSALFIIIKGIKK